MKQEERRDLHERFKQACALALLVSLSSFSLGGCGDEPSVFPRSPNLGPAPRGGAGSQLAPTNVSAGSVTQGGMGGAEGGEGPAVPAGGTTAKGGNATGGSPRGGTGGGDPNPLCGNEQPDEGEECDDGNRLSGDGCSSQCKSKCEVCESTVASYWNVTRGEEANWYEECYRDDTPAEGGPAAGVPRAELCHNLVECVRASGCANETGADVLSSLSVDFTACWCENLGENPEPFRVTQDCYDKDKIVKGPCYTEMLEASEGTSTSELAARLTRGSVPVGRAFKLLNEFDWVWCKEECLHLKCEETGGCNVCSNETGLCTIERVGMSGGGSTGKAL